MIHQLIHLSLSEIYHQFILDMQHTTLLEYIAVFFGIASVWYSRKENILVYPVGLANTIPYMFISIKGVCLVRLRLIFITLS